MNNKSFFKNAGGLLTMSRYNWSQQKLITKLTNNLLSCLPQVPCCPTAPHQASNRPNGVWCSYGAYHHVHGAGGDCVCPAAGPGSNNQHHSAAICTDAGAAGSDAVTDSYRNRPTARTGPGSACPAANAVPTGNPPTRRIRTLLAFIDYSVFLVNLLIKESSVKNENSLIIYSCHEK